ncbi:MAG TPA: protein-disulfide reductase DsbD domain-containing protein [Bryobacteraceae bacterium]|nr:protein-disulfide reductase DsbD domain-containing protein [Bryobacteraceae bacterium]
MTSCICSRRPGRLLALLLAAPWLSLLAQTNAVLSIAAPERLNIKRGGTAELRLKAELRPGFHVNSNAPADEFLIPLKLTWAKEPLESEQVAYPKPQFEKYDFSANPVSVFSGVFEIVTRFKAPAAATPGLAQMTGKLRYQACNNKECLPPRTLDVRFTANLE